MKELLLPTWCPGCGTGGLSLCPACGRSFTHWFRADPAADALPPGLRVWAVAGYAETAARVVMAWKSGHRPDLAAPMRRLGERMGERLAGELPAGDPLLVVPAPSGWRRRWAGNEVVAPWAGAIAAGLGAAGRVARCEALLRRSGGRRHDLARSQRLEERARSISLRPRARGRLDAAGIVLVDDVLTTGATMAACAQQVSQVAPVVGAIVLAATPKPVHRD